MKSYIVKLNSTNKYFEVSFLPMGQIEKIKMVKNKKNATVFQPEGQVLKLEEGDILHKIYNGLFGVNEIRIGANRMGEFSLFCHQQGLKREDITIEEFDAPDANNFFSKTQLKDLKEDMKIMEGFKNKRKKKTKKL